MFGALSDNWAVEEESETIEGLGTEVTIKLKVKLALTISHLLCVSMIIAL